MRVKIIKNKQHLGKIAIWEYMAALAEVCGLGVLSSCPYSCSDNAVLIATPWNMLHILLSVL